MKLFKKIWEALLLGLLCTNILACNKVNPSSNEEIKVNKINNLKDDFIMGMDVSMLPSLEESGVKYYDFNNKEADPLKTLKDNGITDLRVRIWNDPYTKDGKGYGGGNCDLKKALNIGKRAKKYDLKLFLDFHYSDFWADPKNQRAPKDWKNYTLEAKKLAMYNYTKDSLLEFKNEAIPIRIIQIGNEINNGLAGEDDAISVVSLIKAASLAINEIYPEALVAIHFTDSNIASRMKYYAEILLDNAVDYDIFAVSYYPFWHGSLANLNQVLRTINLRYNKKTLIAETSYPYTTSDSDYYGNLITKRTKDMPYDLSIKGQAYYIRDLIECLSNTPDTIGLFYWEGLWISPNCSSYIENYQLWESYGIGSASSFAGEYDSLIKQAGGTIFDNQAFFTKTGYPLESLKVFKSVK